MQITLIHQTEKTEHTFEVVDENKLTSDEISTICEEMNVRDIFVCGRYYINRLK